MNFKEYNDYVIERIYALARSKKELLADLHIHTNISTDGTQNVFDVLHNTRKKGFDIIAITDHDSIGAYEEILNLSFADLDKFPIVIPGIEFSVSHTFYSKRCHVLKYFIDTDNKEFCNNLKKNKEAYVMRSIRQFELIKYNKTIEYYRKNKGLRLSFEGYSDFLDRNVVHEYDYPTLMNYIYSEMQHKGIDIWDVYQKCLEYNDEDKCEERKCKVKVALKKFYQKNKDKDIRHDYSKLTRLLAVVDVDDEDYKGYEYSGSLSVNQYNQVKIEELDNCGLNILAHPNLDLVSLYSKFGHVFSGMELNYRSTVLENEICEKEASRLSVLLTRGSDSHNLTDDFYENISFYKFGSSEVYGLIEAVSNTCK